MHPLRNVYLGHCLEKWIHPRCLEVLPGLNTVGRVAEDYSYNLTDTELHAHVSEDNWRYFQRALGLPHYHSALAWSVPVFSGEFCDALLAEQEHMVYMGTTPTVNPDEDLAFQIPELVLPQLCPALARGIHETSVAALYPWLRMEYQCVPDDVASIQLANYSPRGTQGGNWHHDSDADYTAVVSLNPGCFTGGGTEIKTGLCWSQRVPVLPKGHALIFPGKHVMHRGLQVLGGDRWLLVFWLRMKGSRDE